jgi:glutamate/tyrosine decarboxylase-like PLP-dependent enzyme
MEEHFRSSAINGGDRMPVRLRSALTALLLWSASLTSAAKGLADDEWSAEVLAILAEMDAYVRRAARARERRDGSAGTHVSPLAKFPARSFDYLAELDGFTEPGGATDAELLAEVDAFFRGALRPESPFCLFNSDFRPTVEATAAACLTVMNNVNGLMDAFGGESLLVEQKIARTVGLWAGWPSAMGISCNGGKLTMFYALRCALSRAQPGSLRSGATGRIVVVCSAGAHYSVEHVAALTGIGSENVLRVPLNATGAMRLDALAATLEAAHSDGATVAAVVCCGGTTIDFCCDDTAAVGQVVDQFVLAHALSQAPYLHFDGVIGWLYLAFRDASEAELINAVPEERARARIAEVLRRTTALGRFDSLGADFHKTGLCPYPSSFFVARESRFMDDLGAGDYSYGPGDFRFGSFRAYRYTLENSRPMMGVLAAWVNLCRLGRSGLREYLVGLHRAGTGLQAAIERHGEFALLNRGTLGWEMVVDLPLGQAREYGPEPEMAIAFIEHCWQRVRDGHDLPLISIVPQYHVDHDLSQSRVAFLIYPMCEAAPTVRDAAVQAIGRELKWFRSQRAQADQPRPDRWEKPIR